MNRKGYWLHPSNVAAGTWRATFSRDAMISGRRVRCDAHPQLTNAASPSQEVRLYPDTPGQAEARE
jgi:hypothetical protein